MALIRPIPSKGQTLTKVGSVTSSFGSYTATLDCTSISGYASLSASDFKIVPTSISAHTGNSPSTPSAQTVTPSATYNSSTGTLSITLGGVASGNTLAAYCNADVYYPASLF